MTLPTSWATSAIARKGEKTLNDRYKDRKAWHWMKQQSHCRSNCQNCTIKHLPCLLHFCCIYLYWPLLDRIVLMNSTAIPWRTPVSPSLNSNLIDWFLIFFFFCALKITFISNLEPPSKWTLMWGRSGGFRLQVVPHFPSGIVGWAKGEHE